MKPMRRIEDIDPNLSHPFVEDGTFSECWRNNKYEVLVKRDIKPGEAGNPGMDGGLTITWLSINRRGDKDCVRDWRHMQEIKNDICGSESEGVGLYPRESRKMDNANQFHIWVLEAPNVFPFGLVARTVTEDIESGGKQRKFRPTDRYCDLDGPERLEEVLQANRRVFDKEEARQR